MIVVWRVTQHCNLACGFCAYARDLGFVRAGADPDAVLAFGDVLARHRARTGERVLVSWLGGEPMLWPALARLSSRFRELGLGVSATTNGSTLASPAVRRHVVECYGELTVSVDGPATFHDRVRGSPGGYARIESSVRALATEAIAAGARLRLRINTVLMAGNVGDFAALCQSLADWGIHEISFNQLGGNDRPEFHREHRLDRGAVEAFAAELPGLREALAARGVRLTGSTAYLDRFRASARGERIPVADCHPGERFLFVDEAGIAAPCSFTGAGYGVPVRELASWPDLRRLPDEFRVRARRARAAACDDCACTQVFGKFAA